MTVALTLTLNNNVLALQNVKQKKQHKTTACWLANVYKSILKPPNKLGICSVVYTAPLRVKLCMTNSYIM